MVGVLRPAGVPMMRALLLAFAVCSCAPISVFVTDVQPLSDGSLRVTKCSSAHDLMGRHVYGDDCHTVRRKPVDP